MRRPYQQDPILFTLDVRDAGLGHCPRVEQRVELGGGSTFSASATSRTVRPEACAALAIWAARSYPIAGASAVASARLRSTDASQRSTSTSRPATHFCAKSEAALARISVAVERVVCQQRHHQVELEVAAQPAEGVGRVETDHLGADHDQRLGDTGLTLPGMIEEPG